MHRLGSGRPGNGNGNGNGNGGTPPGQERKAEQQATPAAPATTATTQAPAPEQAKPDDAGKPKPKSEHKRKKPDHEADRKAERKSEQKAKAKVHSKAKVQSKAKTETKASGSKGRSAEAHHHVIICHRTGSASNPYVVINIPWTAWSEAHSPDTGAHPDLDGRHDIMLKNPASRPGSKDGFTKSSCGSAAAPAVAPQQSRPIDICPNVERMQTTLPAGHVKDASGNCVLLAQQTDVCPNIEGMQTTVPAGLVKDASGTCALLATATVVQTKVETTVAKQVEKKHVSQVLAATSPATPAKAKAAATPATGEQPAGGVLGAVASPAESIAQTATSGTLPFTGIPLWIAVLLGAGLLATGVALRRAAQH